MNFKHTFLTVLISTLLTASVFGSTVADTMHLSSYKADVKVVRYGKIKLRGSGTIDFNMTDNGQWSLQYELQGGPVRSFERSQGTIQNNEYLPLSYRRETQIFFSKEKVNWSYNWAAKVLSGEVKKDKYQFKLNTVIHDPISFQLPLRKALMRGETEFEVSQIPYRKPKMIRFEVIGEEVLNIEKRNVKTLILEQTKPVEKNLKKLVWVSLEHDFIPIRFSTYENDKIRDRVTAIKLDIY